MQLTDLTQEFTTAWQKLMHQPAPPAWSVSRPESWQFGEFTSNIALVGFPQLDSTQRQDYPNPRALAIALTTELSKQTTVRFSVAGPGFINIQLSDQHILDSILTQTQIRSHYQAKTVLVEFTDPNPFKEFHIGHLYSNIVGESIARLLELGGADTHRVCYQGDVGMHVAKSIWGLKRKMKTEQISLEVLASQPLPTRIKFLGQAYALGATAYEEDQAAATEIKDINYLVFIFGQEQLIESQQWQAQVDYRSKLSHSIQSEAEIKELYLTGRSWSLAYFETIYQRLGTRFEEYFFESLVGELGLQLVREGQTKNIFIESQGAVIYPGSQKKLHDRVFINSQGLPTYEAKELGLAPEKYRRIPYDYSFIITGNEIIEYFKVLLSALTAIRPDLAEKTKHFSHGMVRLPDGKMSSRTGKILTGEWLLDEAKQRVLTILNASQQTGKTELSDQEVDATAEQIGQSAIKFALLSSRLGKDIAFDFDTSLNFSGFSGPYLQYTATRCKSVLQKAVQQEQHPVPELKSTLTSDERLLLQELSRSNEIQTKAVNELSPHVIAEYLFKIAQAFNAFYTNQPIIGSEQASFRLWLCERVQLELNKGLALLGIQVPKQM